MFNYLNKLDVSKVFDSWILLKLLCYEVMASSSLRGPTPAAILASHTPQLSGLVHVALWLGARHALRNRQRNVSASHVHGYGATSLLCWSARVQEARNRMCYLGEGASDGI